MMASIFGAPSTADAVLQGVDLTGFRILVTGVSAGIGLESARVLAAHGAWVVGAARDLGKARAATAQVGADASSLCAPADAGGGDLAVHRRSAKPGDHADDRRRPRHLGARIGITTVLHT